MGEVKSSDFNRRNISWNEIDSWIELLRKSVTDSNYKPDVLVGVTRGGLIPVVLLSDKLDALRVLTITVRHWPVPGKMMEEAQVTQDFEEDLSGKRILLVEDIADTGKSFHAAIDHIRRRNKPAEIRTAALQYASDTSSYKPDYYAEEFQKKIGDGKSIWVTYPWTIEEDNKSLENR